jgi:hypothetical protein
MKWVYGGKPIQMILLAIDAGRAAIPFGMVCGTN